MYDVVETFVDEMVVMVVLVVMVMSEISVVENFNTTTFVTAR